MRHPARRPGLVGTVIAAATSAGVAALPLSVVAAPAATDEGKPVGNSRLVVGGGGEPADAGTPDSFLLAPALDGLGGWRQLRGRGHGRVLAVEPVLFAGLPGLGAVNRHRVLPALMAGTARASRPRGTVRGELGLAAAVLAATALTSAPPQGSGRTEPAASAATPRFVQMSRVA
jgi:hypothetical protein